MVRAGYTANYRAYKHLYDHTKLIDNVLADDLKDSVGIKYSCFDNVKPKAQ